MQRAEKTAHAQNREPAGIVSEAVRKYLNEQSWVKFVEQMNSEHLHRVSAKTMLTG